MEDAKRPKPLMSYYGRDVTLGRYGAQHSSQRIRTRRATRLFKPVCSTRGERSYVVDTSPLANVLILVAPSTALTWGSSSTVPPHQSSGRMCGLRNWLQSGIYVCPPVVWNFSGLEGWAVHLKSSHSRIDAAGSRLSLVVSPLSNLMALTLERRWYV